MNSVFARISRSKHFRFGLPFFIFIFGGQYALKTFRELRYDVRVNPNANKNLVKPEEAFQELNEKTGQQVYVKQDKSAEEELQQLDSKVDWDNWENKRGPRPWEGTVEKREVKRLVKSVPTVKELTEN